MTIRNRVLWSSSFALAATCLTLLVFRPNTAEVEAQVVAGNDRLAFTVVQITESLDQGGSPYLSETKVTAQRSDGAQAIQVYRSFGTETSGFDLRSFRNVFDVNARRHYGIDHLTRSLTTKVMGERQANQMTSKPSCNGVVESELLGYPAVKVTEEISPNGNLRVTIEKWLAPELDCFPLRTIVITTDGNGTVVGRNITRPLLVSIGDPNLVLFEVPFDYVERSPSQVLEEAVRIDQIPGFDRAMADNLDRSYYWNK